MNKVEIKHWGYYLANIPYWDSGSLSFKYKARPILVFNFSGGDVIALPITSNEDKDGKETANDKPWLINIKLERFSLIKVNKPITIDKKSLFKFFGVQANVKTRRKVRKAWKEWATPKEIKR